MKVQGAIAGLGLYLGEWWKFGGQKGHNFNGDRMVGAISGSKCISRMKIHKTVTVDFII